MSEKISYWNDLSLFSSALTYANPLVDIKWGQLFKPLNTQGF